jgi:predicted nuclease with RNAse H fold
MSEQGGKPLSSGGKFKAQKEDAETNAAAEHKVSKSADQPPAGQQMLHKKPTGLGASLGANLTNAAPAVPLDEATSAVLQATITALQKRYQEMPGRIKLTGLVRDVTALSTHMSTMPQTIADYRRRGYPYHDYLENKIQVFNQHWATINDEIKHWINRESSALETEFNAAEPLFQRLTAPQLTSVHQNATDNAATILDNLEAKIKAAETHIETLYSQLAQEVSQVRHQLDRIGGYLDLKDAASFDFMAGEAVYVVNQAEWDNNSDKPDGYIYLTNHRLIFEQKEKTGKTLGLFGGKEVHKVLWEVPLNLIENAEPEDKGLFGGKDMVHFQLGTGAPYARITVEIKGGIDSKAWVAELKKMLRGELNGGTINDPELVERLRNAPTACPTCAAMLPQLVAGQNSLTCQYCGTVVRI